MSNRIRLYTSPLLTRGAPMQAFIGRRSLSTADLKAMPDSALDVLSSVANDLFDIAYSTNRFTLADDVGRLVKQIDKEQYRRCG
jgi:hypothetical protein